MYLNNHKLHLVIFIVVALSGLIFFSSLNKQGKIENKSDKIPINVTDSPVEINCSRTSRLENRSPYDRALSLIEEKYDLWEKSGSGYGSWYFFPPKLVNCIKIVESNVKSKTGAEGYFTFNSPDIKNNYFPINVDSDYIYADDAINSLILVHEITHVEQYLQSLDKKKIQLSCIDKEVEAFYALWKFYSIQFPETLKSINLRIENDNDLHPQLQLLRIMKDNFSFEGVRSKCLNGLGKDDKNCIDNYRKNEIKTLLLQDGYYKEQCKL